MVHCSVHRTLFMKKFYDSSIIVKNGSHQFLSEAWNSMRIITRKNKTSVKLVICVADDMLVKTHTFFFFSPCDTVCSFLLCDNVCSTKKRLLFLIGLNSALTDDSWVRYGFVQVEGGVLERWQAAWWVKTLQQPRNEREIRKSPPLSNEPHLYTALNTREKL